MAKVKVVYPLKPATEAGYTDEWILAYLANEATAKEIAKYKKAIAGVDKKQRRKIFYEMFIVKKDKFDDALSQLIAEKKQAEKQAE